MPITLYRTNEDPMMRLSAAIEPHTYVPSLKVLLDACDGATDVQTVVRPFNAALAARRKNGTAAIVGPLRDKLLRIANEINAEVRGAKAA